MEIPEQVVAEVVKEASLKMSDPNYSAVMVGGFVQGQGTVAQYIGANAEDVGGTENVVHCIFHASLIAECFKRANNRSVPEISFRDLDEAAISDRETQLGQKQPAVLGYIQANVESDSMQRVLMLVALAMELVS